VLAQIQAASSSPADDANMMVDLEDMNMWLVRHLMASTHNHFSASALVEVGHEGIRTSAAFTKQTATVSNAEIVVTDPPGVMQAQLCCTCSGIGAAMWYVSFHQTQ
jgi:hypothetical protein